MNIAVDIEPIVSASKYRGMGIYTRGLLNKMFEQDKKNNYFLFNMYEDLPLNEILTCGSNVSYNYFYMGMNSCLISPKYFAMEEYEEKYEDVVGALYKKFIKINNIDTFFLTATLDTLCCLKKEWFEGINLVLIVYDIIPLLFASEYVKGKGGKKYCMDGLELWKSADKILAISGSVKSDLIKYLEINEDKVDEIYCGVDIDFLKKKYEKQEITQVLEKFKITDNFFLFPAAEDFRKNLVPTIEAFAMFDENDKFQLVVTGFFSEQSSQKLNKIIIDSGIEGRVIITNYVSSAQIRILYNSAKLLIFPSLYEGFGLPVVEAFACGLPVITSNNSSLVEVAQDAAVIVDPYSKQSIAQGIKTALYDTNFSDFKPIIEERLKQFTWENSAKLALNAINSLSAKKVKKRNIKKKVAFFAPLDTQNKMIGTSYKNILNEISKCFEVDVFVEKIKDYNLQKEIKILNAGEFAAYSMRYDYVVYNMANSLENMYMISSLVNYNGTVILHDFNINPSAYEYFVSQKENWDGYQSLLKCEISNYIEIIGEMKRDNNIAKKVVCDLEILNCVVDNAKNIIVCDEIFKEKLLKKDIGYNVFTIMPYEYNANQKMIESDKKSIVITGDIYGLQDIESVLKSARKMNNDSIKYIILNKISDKIKDEIKETYNDILHNIVFINDINKDEQKNYLLNSNVCIKLKHPLFSEKPLDFYDTLINCRSLIVLDNTVPKAYDGYCCEILTYEDKAYHISKTVEKFLNVPEYKNRMWDNIKTLFDVENMGEKICDCICEEEDLVVNEELLRKIYERELLPRGLANDYEMSRIAQTFAYIKEKTHLNNTNKNGIMKDSKLISKGRV